MRSHAKLSRDQIALNALIAGAPAAVVAAAHLEPRDLQNHLRGRTMEQLGGQSVTECERRAREIRVRLSNLLLNRRELKRTSTIQERLNAKRRDQVIEAASISLRVGARPEYRVLVAAEGQQPSYTIERDRRWLGNDKWGTDFWSHRIFLPPSWMTLVRAVGAGRGYASKVGLLNDGRFVLDCLTVTPTGIYGGGNVYEVRAVRNGRGNEVIVETVYVRTWPTGHETYHTTAIKALKSKPTDKIKLAMSEAKRTAPTPPDEDLKAMAMLAEENA